MDRNPPVRKTTRPPIQHKNERKEQALFKRAWTKFAAIAAVIAVIAGAITNIGTIEGTVVSVYHHFFPYSAPTPNPNQALLSEVEGLLAPGVNIQLYQSKFGVPAFINYHTDHTTKYKEYVFVNIYFYLDAVTDMNDAVQMFAITIRDKTFNPVFSPVDHLFNQPIFQITLGLSKLSDVSDHPQYIFGCSGQSSERFSYYETLYLGERGGDEEFGFGFNEAGYLPSNADFHVLYDNPQFCGGTSGYTDLQTLKQLRTQIPFNTYAVAVGDLSIEKYAHYDLGVNFDQVK